MLPGESYSKPRPRPGFYPEPRNRAVFDGYIPPTNVLRTEPERVQPGGERYPEQRPARPNGAEGLIAEKFPRYESSGEVTCGDTLVDVHTFSGFPDNIDLMTRSFPAIVRLASKLGEETSDILVPVGTVIQTGISRPLVRARNAIAGSNAVLVAVGKWREPYGSH